MFYSGLHQQRRLLTAAAIISRMRVGSLSCSKTRRSRPFVLRSLNLFAPYISLRLDKEKLPEALGSNPSSALLPSILAKPVGPPWEDKRCLSLLYKVQHQASNIASKIIFLVVRGGQMRCARRHRPKSPFKPILNRAKYIWGFTVFWVAQ